MIFFIEGARNVGKTYLIDKLNKPVYKFPFKDVYTEYSSMSDSHINSNKELFYLNLGYDITLLDLVKNGQIKHDIIVDRGILSDIIFGIQSGRITKELGIKWWNYLCMYEDYFETIYIYSKFEEDNRNKDMWEFYESEKTHQLYLEFMDEIDYEPIIFKNNKNKKSVNKFISLF